MRSSFQNVPPWYSLEGPSYKSTVGESFSVPCDTVCKKRSFKSAGDESQDIVPRAHLESSSVTSCLQCAERRRWGRMIGGGFPALVNLLAVGI